jgi:hypothetical protein
MTSTKMHVKVGNRLAAESAKSRVQLLANPKAVEWDQEAGIWMRTR